MHCNCTLCSLCTICKQVTQGADSTDCTEDFAQVKQKVLHRLQIAMPRVAQKAAVQCQELETLQRAMTWGSPAVQVSSLRTAGDPQPLVSQSSLLQSSSSSSASASASSYESYSCKLSLETINLNQQDLALHQSVSYSLTNRWGLVPLGTKINGELCKTNGQEAGVSNPFWGLKIERQKCKQ